MNFFQLPLLIFSLLISYSGLHAQYWIQKGSDLVGENGSVIAIGAPSNSGVSFGCGQTKVFEWDGIDWVQKGQSIYGTYFNYSGVGIDMSADGNYVVIGAPQEATNGTNAGCIRTYEWQDSLWVQRGADIYGLGTEEWEGWRVCISDDGNTVGTSNHDVYNSHVRLFNWDGSSWSQKGGTLYGATDENYGSGIDLSSDGSTVVIGMSGTYGTLGTSFVEVRTWNGTEWALKGSKVIPGDIAGFGLVVQINSNGNTYIAGAHHDDGYKGSITVYDWSGTEWILRDATIFGEAGSDEFGYDVGISADGHTILSGAPKNDGAGADIGHARVYTMDNLSVTEIILGSNQIYPNPCNRNITLKGLNNFDYLIMGVDGSLKKKGYSSNGSLDLATLSSGIYILYLKKDGVAYRFKFVKNPD